MGKVIVWNLVTLDGRFEGSTPWDLSFHQQAWGPELRALSETFLADTEALVFGRKTYEGMAAYWPEAEEDDEARIKAFMNALPKLVASRRPGALAWNNSRATADIVGELGALKARAAKNLYVFGSAELVASLLPAGLIDEIIVAIVPRILGAGRRLFEDGTNVPLRLVSSEATSGGTAILRYGVEG